MPRLECIRPDSANCFWWSKGRGGLLVGTVNALTLARGKAYSSRQVKRTRRAAKRAWSGSWCRLRALTRRLRL